MNSKQLYDMLLGYPVTICTADQHKIQRGRFFFSNTDTSQGQGEDWVAFYFPKRFPFEFYDSLGHMPEDYGVGFEKILKRKYLKNVGQLQQSTVELRWLELVGTVGASSTHPCVQAIPSLTIFQVGSCVLYVITDTSFFIDQRDQ